MIGGIEEQVMMVYCPQCNAEVSGLSVCPECNLQLVGVVCQTDEPRSLPCNVYRARLEAFLPSLIRTIDRLWNIVAEFAGDGFELTTPSGLVVSVNRARNPRRVGCHDEPKRTVVEADQ